MFLHVAAGETQTPILGFDNNVGAELLELVRIFWNLQIPALCCVELP